MDTRLNFTASVCYLHSIFFFPRVLGCSKLVWFTLEGESLNRTNPLPRSPANFFFRSYSWTTDVGDFISTAVGDFISTSACHAIQKPTNSWSQTTLPSRVKRFEAPCNLVLLSFRTTTRTIHYPVLYYPILLSRQPKMYTSKKRHDEWRRTS